MKEDNFKPDYCLIRDGEVIVGGQKLFTTRQNDDSDPFLVKAYRATGISYPKFFKMDNLSKTGFLAAELLLRGSVIDTQMLKPDVAVVLMTRNASLDTDMSFQATISDPEAYFPSPSIFVYTLPNIMLGEICIRFRITGEGIVFAEKEINTGLLYDSIMTIFGDGTTTTCIYGWVDFIRGEPQALLSSVTREMMSDSYDKRTLDCFINETFGSGNRQQ